MKRILILILAASSWAFAQQGGNVVFQAPVPVGAVAWGAFEKSSGGLVQGAPFSATTTNESIQTLADGNRIVQSSSGTTARDSQGRTRQDAPLPPIGGLAPADAPHIVFLQDPVAQTAYTLNLTDKVAQKMPMPPGGAGLLNAGGPGTAIVTMGVGAPMPPPPSPGPVFVQRYFSTGEQAQVNTEDLGSQTIEGVLVMGVRTTRTIPAGQIGNDRPISIVTEVWSSADLKTIVRSKRSDPRMGEQTFQLTNIVRAEPDPSLFTVPADFKVIDGPQPILYRSNR